MEQNSFGLIFFLVVLSICYVGLTGQVRPLMEGDSTPDQQRKFWLSLFTLPLLGIAVSLSYPHYTAGLAGAGLILGFMLTLHRVSHGFSALTTEPMAVGILYLVSRRSSIGGDPAADIEAVLARFGYSLTIDHLGYLTGGILAGIVAGILPRMMLKRRTISQAKRPVLNARQKDILQRKQLKEKTDKAIYSRKLRKSGALAERMRGLK